MYEGKNYSNENQIKGTTEMQISNKKKWLKRNETADEAVVSGRKIIVLEVVCVWLSLDGCVVFDGDCGIFFCASH